MYNNFTEYWEFKRGIYNKLGIDKEIVYTIWVDALEVVEKKLFEDIVKNK